MTEKGSPDYVPSTERIAAFDQNGTGEKPELKVRKPFETVVSGDSEASAKTPHKDLEEWARHSQASAKSFPPNAYRL